MPAIKWYIPCKIWEQFPEEREIYNTIQLNDSFFREYSHKMAWRAPVSGDKFVGSAIDGGMEIC